MIVVADRHAAGGYDDIAIPSLFQLCPQRLWCIASDTEIHRLTAGIAYQLAECPSVGRDDPTLAGSRCRVVCGMPKTLELHQLIA